MLKDTVARELRELIQKEIRRGVVRPVMRDTTQGGAVADAVVLPRVDSNPDQWFVWYEAADDVTPDGDTPAWVDVEDGSPVAAVADDLLTVEAPTTYDSLFYSYEYVGLDNDSGTTVEASLRVVSDDSGANQGACVAIADGDRLFVLWLRADGLNIDGQANVPLGLSDALHRVRFRGEGNRCDVWVDGLWRQTGVASGPTTAAGVAFGTWVSNDLS